MGLQLVFVVETDKKCKSDWIYIKETINHFFQWDQTQIKLSTVYMAGKGNYKRKKSEIERLKAEYKAGGKDNRTQVIYCFDCDDYDFNSEDNFFLQSAQSYCEENGFEFVWFCKDIECVFLGYKVDDTQKSRISAQFKNNELIKEVNENKLKANQYQKNTSNILMILSKYLSRA